MPDDSKKHSSDLAKIGEKYRRNEKIEEEKGSKNNDSSRVTKDIDPFRHIRSSTDALTKFATHQRLNFANLAAVRKLIVPLESPAFRLIKEMEEREKRLFCSMGKSACSTVEKTLIDPLHSFHAQINEVSLTFRKTALARSDLVGGSFISLHDSFTHLWNPSILAKVNSALDPIVDMNKRLQETFRFSTAVGRLMQEDENRRKMLLGLSSQLFSPSKKLGLLDYDAIGVYQGVGRHAFTALERAVNESLSLHDNLVKSFDELGKSSNFPDFAIPDGTSEIYDTLLPTNSLQSLNEDVELDIIPLVKDCKCVELLADYSPDLVPMYEGAIESMLGNNPDWKRHTLTSLRELCSSIIRLLGPDEMVNHWIDRQPSRKAFTGENDKPTRYARLKYISRNIKNHDLAEYFDNLFRYFNKLYNILSRIHEPDISLSPIEICAIIIEVEAKLKLLLTMSKMNW